MSRNNTLTHESDKRINMKYLPSWNDDNMPLLSDNDPTDGRGPLWPDETPLDANSIEDYDNLEGHEVFDQYGQVIGEVMRPRKRRPRKNR